MFRGFGFHMRDMYGGDGLFDSGVDRRDWKDKSDAATRREHQAMQLFEKCLEESKSSPTFPVTSEGVVPPNVHLTDACWKTFRKHVAANGCTAKRREATQAEKNALSPKDRRNGKMYVISVVVPVHPTQALGALQEKQLKAKQAAEKKVEKAKQAAEKSKQEAERKAEQEGQLQTTMKQEYASAVSWLDENGNDNDNEKKPAAVCLKDDNKNNKRENDDTTADDDDVKESPKKRLKLKLKAITVPRERILQHAEEESRKRMSNMRYEMGKEKREERDKLLAVFDTKWLAKEAAKVEEERQYCDRIKHTILMAGEQ
jgi:hypothetical protein